jgi:hypothetical protein
MGKFLLFLFKCSHKNRERVEYRYHSTMGTTVDTGLSCKRCGNISEKKQRTIQGMWTWQGVKRSARYQNEFVNF